MKASIESSGLPRTPGADLRQVKLLSQRNCHSKVGAISKLLCANVAQSKYSLSWYVPLNSTPSEEKILRIPQIKWSCPHKFDLNTSWNVAAGEGSQEAEAQKRRESTVLEVVYPDLTAVPPSPFTSPKKGECSDNFPTPIIPMIPVEEVAGETPFDTSASENVRSVPVSLPLSQTDPCGPQGQTVLDKSLSNMLCGLERIDLEVAATAAATVAAVMEKKEQIDTQLLIKLLTDPEMVKKLLEGNGQTPKPKNQTLPAPCPNTSLLLPSSTLVSEYSNESVTKLSHFSRSSESEIQHVRSLMPYPGPNIAGVMPVGCPNRSTSNQNLETVRKMIIEYGAPGAPSVEETPNAYRVDRGWGKPFVGPSPTPLPPVTNPALHSRLPFFSPVATPAPNVDVGYYKSLIKQHGERHETGKQKLPIIGQIGNCLQGLEKGHNSISSTVINPKFGKPCIYFGSSKGCRIGCNCQHRHDVSRQGGRGAMESQVAKRTKFVDRMGSWR